MAPLVSMVVPEVSRACAHRTGRENSAIRHGKIVTPLHGKTKLHVRKCVKMVDSVSTRATGTNVSVKPDSKVTIVSGQLIHAKISDVIMGANVPSVVENIRANVYQHGKARNVAKALSPVTDIRARTLAHVLKHPTTLGDLSFVHADLVQAVSIVKIMKITVLMLCQMVSTRVKIMALVLMASPT